MVANFNPLRWWRKSVGKRRPLTLGFVAGAGVTVFAMALVAPLVLLSHRSDWPLERWYGHKATGFVSRLKMGERQQPLPSDTTVLGQARFNYSVGCAFCHGSAGKGDGPSAKSLYPPPTDFTNDAAKSRSDEHLFWVTKNGLAFTAMPAYPQYTDDQVWALVAYLRLLQEGKGESVPRVTPTPPPSTSTPAPAASPTPTATPGS